MNRIVLFVLLLATVVALAEDVPEVERAASATEAQARTEDEAEPVAGSTETQTEEGPRSIDGMSVLGNREAPKSLVIVPWKSSEIGDSLGISPMLDDSRQPVDREVFMRALSYYEIQRAGRGDAADVDEETGQ
jgi:hypothetical protein